MNSGYFKPIEVSFWINDEDDCFNISSHALGKSGYPQIKHTPAHRYLFEQVYGPIPEGMIIRHSCDNPLCINPAHLLLGTHADNVQDRVDRNRSAHGEENGRAKLTEKQVRRVKNSALPNAVLARRYGVDRRVIYQIKKGLTWTHV